MAVPFPKLDTARLGVLIALVDFVFLAKCRSH